MPKKLYLKDVLNINPDIVPNSKIVLNMTLGKGKESCIDAWLNSDKNNRNIEFTFWSNYGKQKNFCEGNIVFGFARLNGFTNRYLLIAVSKIIHVPDYAHCSHEPLKEYNGYLGRLIIEVEKGNAFARYVFNLSRYIGKCEVIQILQTEYGTTPFPGYSDSSFDFQTLKRNIDYDEWKYPLSSVNGVYLIFDASNGKKYIGSAYGSQGIYGRWKAYLENGFDESEEESGIYYPNKQLKRIVNSPEKGMKYIQDNFIYTILEVLPFNTDKDRVIHREQYWKRVMHTINSPYGYNSN
jgi:hypothetical protein